MTENDIIVQGEMVKYLLLIDREDFSMATGNFQVELRWGLQGESKVITKEDMLEATSGWLFSFSTAGMLGKVTATCTWYYEDSDVPGALRPETDEQVIAFVVSTPCPKFQCCPKSCGDHDVTYTRTEDSDIAAAYMRMVDVYDRPILTVDNEYIYVLRSAVNNE